MIKFARFYTLIGLISLSTAVFIVIYYFHDTTRQELINLGEAENVQFATMFKNTLWNELSLHIDDFQGLDNRKLRQHHIVTQIGQSVRAEAKGLNILQINVYDATGNVIFSTEMRQLGDHIEGNSLFLRAFEGDVISSYGPRDIINGLDGMKLDRQVIVTYMPVYLEETTTPIAIFQVITDVTNSFNKKNNAENVVNFAIGLIFIINFILLVIGVRKTNRYIVEQANLIEKQKEHIDYRYNYDSITRLPKLNVFFKMLADAMEKNKNKELLLAVLVIDLDRVQKINDTLGYQSGDELILETSTRLNQCVRKFDAISRLGCDKFTIMLTGITVIDEVEEVVEYIKDALSDPYHIADTELFVSPSIGVSMYPFSDDDAESLVRKANAAMLKAKRGGNNMSHFYTQGAGQQEESRFSIENALRHALERNEFELYYQPVISLNKGEVSALEALLRWHSPQLGLVEPLDFIPLLEDTGLIKDVGQWVLERACIDAVKWQKSGFEKLRMNVNVSAVQFLQNDILRQTDNAIKISGINPYLLDLEITESLLLDGISNTIKTLDDLSNMGVSLSIDDFGTGYSSLAYLKRLPINTLKIDRAFVRDVTTNIDDAAIIDAICALSASLRFKVLGEGVETMEQLMYLRGLGVNSVQGFLFSPPLPAAEVLEFLRRKIDINQLATAV